MAKIKCPRTLEKQCTTHLENLACWKKDQQSEKAEIEKMAVTTNMLQLAVSIKIE
jgi:hypothetical protein